jgi:hypothetical protein
MKLLPRQTLGKKKFGNALCWFMAHQGHEVGETPIKMKGEVQTHVMKMCFMHIYVLRGSYRGPIIGSQYRSGCPPNETPPLNETCGPFGAVGVSYRRGFSGTSILLLLCSASMWEGLQEHSSRLQFQCKSQALMKWIQADWHITTWQVAHSELTLSMNALDATEHCTLPLV